MSTGLTDKDMDRIRDFLDTPPYDREPEQLLPEQNQQGKRTRDDEDVDGTATREVPGKQ